MERFWAMLKDNSLVPVCPSGTDLTVWWSAVRRPVNKADKRKLDTVVILACWTVWKERNARIFDAKQETPGRLLEAFKEELMAWKMAGLLAE
uniref:OO_Ba0013J05-OO_Ba0033A15.9 protein n=1 Tax=Oryza officinalis TaxID=4535 RepID=D0ABF2_9ORYZ|nr:OO_Ba0013J05-OO_Ba0033A15.9 [Oryza officinalis]